MSHAGKLIHRIVIGVTPQPVPPAPVNYRLLEDGAFRLLEDGIKRKLENNV